MINHRSVNALLLMGGEGQRFGSSVPKQFLPLAGKKIYLHSLDVFVRSGLFDRVFLACHPDWLEMVKSETAHIQCVKVVCGGKSRQESSFLGLREMKGCEIVVIHDAVRPFVTEEILRENIAAARRFGAADTCIGSADTLVYSPGGDEIQDIPRRADFLRGQTPQSFRYQEILEAHERARSEGLEATDDCRLAMAAGMHVQVVAGDETNIKITTELDLYMAEQLFRLRMRSGANSSGVSLRGKVFALVGGSGGIGSAVATALNKEGARAISMCRSGEISMDLRDAASVQAAFSKLHETWGEVDGLINCAGKLVVKPLEQMSLSEIEEVLQVNLQGVILCCQAARLKAGAHVVNVASSSFTRGRKDYGIYSSAKAGVVNFTQALAEERPELRVWSVIPQRTRTSMRLVQFPGEDASSLLEPEVVAQHILSTLKDPSSSGQLLEVKKHCQKQIFDSRWV